MIKDSGVCVVGETPRNTIDSPIPCRWLWNIEGNTDGNALEICGAHNFQILHIFRVVEEIVTNAWCLMAAVAGGYERLLVFVHKSCPSLKHDDNLKVSLVNVPAGS